MSAVAGAQWNRAQTWAVLLAPIGMLVGFGVLVAWMVTEWDVLPMVGFLVIGLGVLATVAVVVLATVGGAAAAKEGKPFRQRSLPSILALGVMFANYPAALLTLSLAQSYATRFVLTVVNGSDVPWQELRLVGPGVDELIGTLSPGARAERTVWFQGEGEFLLRDRTADVPHEHTLVRYVATGYGGNGSVVRNALGDVTMVVSWRRSAD